MANFCPNCGIKVEQTWKACPECGQFFVGVKNIPQSYDQQYYQQTSQYPTSTTPQTYPAPYQQRIGNDNGTLALVFGLIGLFCCCGAIIFGPLAIIYGNKGKETDDEPTLAQFGFILGIIDIACCILLIFITFMFVALYYY